MDFVDVIRDHRDMIEEQFDVERIGVFGSAVRGEMTSDSDVDVLVEFRSGKASFDRYMDLKFFLEDLFSRDVDLVTIRSIKSRIRDHVLSQAKYA